MQIIRFNAVWKAKLREICAETFTKEIPINAFCHFSEPKRFVWLENSKQNYNIQWVSEINNFYLLTVIILYTNLFEISTIFWKPQIPQQPYIMVKDQQRHLRLKTDSQINELSLLWSPDHSAEQNQKTYNYGSLVQALDILQEEHFIYPIFLN